MLTINENGRILGKEIHRAIESKTKQYNIWINRAIKDADVKEGIDFHTILYESTGGRPSTDYEFTLTAAKEICLLERNEKGKKIRQWLIGLSEQKENLELITVKEAAFAIKVINCLKYIDNQKDAYSMHQKQYFATKVDVMDKKYIYSEFALYRAKITGWDKKSVDNAIDVYLTDHSGHNKSKLDKQSMSVKLSVMDIGEAIRVAVLDILYSKQTDSNLAKNFSVLCKNLAKEMEVTAERENKTNLFKEKENIENIRMIGL